MNKKQICCILFLFATCSMFIDGLLAQSIPDIAHQEREQKKGREKIQQEQEKKHPKRTSSRTSIGWGLGCLFIPFVSLVYLIQYWEEARWPFTLQVVGILILGIALVWG